MAINKITVTPERQAELSKTVDWKRVTAMTEDEIEQDLATDPDAASPLTEAEGIAIHVQLVRRRIGLSQPKFAERFHIPLGTLRDWEQARREPDAAALAYLRVIERNPKAVIEALEPIAVK